MRLSLFFRTFGYGFWNFICWCLLMLQLNPFLLFWNLLMVTNFLLSRVDLALILRNWNKLIILLFVLFVFLTFTDNSRFLRDRSLPFLNFVLNDWFLIFAFFPSVVNFACLVQSRLKTFVFFKNIFTWGKFGSCRIKVFNVILDNSCCRAFSQKFNLVF